MVEDANMSGCSATVDVLGTMDVLDTRLPKEVVKATVDVRLGFREESATVLARLLAACCAARMSDCCMGFPRETHSSWNGCRKRSSMFSSLFLQCRDMQPSAISIRLPRAALHMQRGSLVPQPVLPTQELTHESVKVNAVEAV